MNTRDIERSARQVIKNAIKHSTRYESSDYEGNTLESVFLGTVFSLTPSGKFYTPFANSNVDTCKRCQGIGHTWKVERTFTDYEGNTREEYQTCPHCHGVGSREAYEDQVFNEELEAAAGRAGWYIESGEGDPCDIFMVRVIDSPESEDDTEE
jgi:hypothetical protein